MTRLSQRAKALIHVIEEMDQLGIDKAVFIFQTEQNNSNISTFTVSTSANVSNQDVIYMTEIAKQVGLKNAVTPFLSSVSEY
jgi:CTP synthase (UTP-ammonia lyase)